MKILISGKQINLGNALQQHANDSLNKCVHKYFEKAVQAEIHFNRERDGLFACDIVVHEGTGQHLIIKADSKSDDIYAAFDLALVKLSRQLRKYKSKIKDHHKQKFNQEELDQVIRGKKYTLKPHTGASHDGDEDETTEDNPIIIAEKPTNIEPITVSEAVMKMDLHNLPALIFINKANGRINMVCYREDGNISWIDTGE